MLKVTQVIPLITFCKHFVATCLQLPSFSSSPGRAAWKSLPAPLPPALPTAPWCLNTPFITWWQSVLKLAPLFVFAALTLIVPDPKCFSPFPNQNITTATWYPSVPGSGPSPHLHGPSPALSLTPLTRWGWPHVFKLFSEAFWFPSNTLIWPRNGLLSALSLQGFRTEAPQACSGWTLCDLPVALLCLVEK